MKLFKQSKFYFLLFLSLAVMSCNSNDDNGSEDDMDEGTGGTTTEFVTAKIDGADFEASQDPASLIGATKSTDSGITLLTLQGSTNDGKFIQFTIFGYEGLGTYMTGDNLSNTNFLQYGELEGTTNANLWANNLITATLGTLDPGMISVDVDADGVIEGTFSFIGYNGEDKTTKDITEGRFKAALDN